MKTDNQVLASEIKKFFSSRKMGHDYGLFYDGIMDSWDYTKKNGEWRYRKEVVPANPKEYCPYFGSATGSFKMGMWFDGEVYIMFHGFNYKKALDAFYDLLERHGMEIIFPDSTHAEFIAKA